MKSKLDFNSNFQTNFYIKLLLNNLFYFQNEQHITESKSFSMFIIFLKILFRNFMADQFSNKNAEFNNSIFKNL